MCLPVSSALRDYWDRTPDIVVNVDVVTYSDPFGLCPPNDNNTADYSYEFKRLLALDKPLEDPGLADPMLLVGGIEKKEGEAAIAITEAGLAHVAERHTVGGASTAGKSIFHAGEDVVGLVRNSESVAAVKQSFGRNYQRIVDAGRDIGIDRATGKPTPFYTVITNVNDRLKFPTFDLLKFPTAGACSVLVSVYLVLISVLLVSRSGDEGLADEAGLPLLSEAV